MKNHIFPFVIIPFLLLGCENKSPGRADEVNSQTPKEISAKKKIQAHI